MGKQRVTVTTNSDLLKTRTLSVSESEYRCSWTTRNDGYGHIHFRAHTEKQWLAINTVETANKRAGNRTYTKQTFFTMEADAVKALYEMLREVFEPRVKAPALTLEEAQALLHLNRDDAHFRLTGERPEKTQ